MSNEAIKLDIKQADENIEYYLDERERERDLVENEWPSDER